jgi:hypothetical protein
MATPFCRHLSSIAVSAGSRQLMVRSIPTAIK